jgi:hypothetical protein
MKITRARLGLLVILVLCLSVPALAAEVVQGKCVSYDKEKKVLVIDEHDANITQEQKFGKSTGKQFTFTTADAVIGISPAPGDMIRVAYKVAGTENKAVRIMNVTKQDLMKK